MITKPIKVILVDDHAVVRAGYRRLLEQNSDIQVIAEAADGEQGYKAYLQFRPDVMILDLSMPGMGGFEAIRRILAEDENARLLVFSMHEDAVFAERALQAGAKGYITKSSGPNVLLEAVEQVAAGNMFLGPDIAQKLALQKLKGVEPPLRDLSPRELEIFRLLAEGHTTQEISEMMYLSYKTVANYSTQIKNKLKLSNAAEMVRLAIRHGLIKA
jgi:DNA-binding NarL/FixJ family response regulator